jgi:RHS repeat-associated protein
MGQKDVPPHLFGAARYINDALGRRLKKTVQDGQGQLHPTYFGWDGDRLVHTESLWGEGQSLERDIVHVVYEPGAFTPMLRLSATIKGAWKAQPYFMVQAAIAGLPQHKKNDDDVWGNLQAMQNALERMAPSISRQLDANMRRIVREEPAENLLTGMGQHLDGIMTVGDVRKALQEKQRQANITVLYFHCDHIGTPLALLDQHKKIVWAARRDPWGNLQEQYNPQGIIQPIGLPGQHYDRETGLYYNGHRYYDARIGAYINQDPIGLLGGLNLSKYADNPISQIDPRGLQAAIETVEDPAVEPQLLENTESVESFTARYETQDNSATFLDEFNDKLLDIIKPIYYNVCDMYKLPPNVNPLTGDVSGGLTCKKPLTPAQLDQLEHGPFLSSSPKDTPECVKSHWVQLKRGG